MSHSTPLTRHVSLSPFRSSKSGWISRRRRDLRRRFLPTSFRMAFSRRAKRDAIFMLRWKFRAMRIIELGFSRR